MNEGVNIHWKAVTENLFTVVGTLVEPSSKYIENSTIYIEASVYIMQTPIELNSNSPVIPPSLHISFFFSSIMVSNVRTHQGRGWQWSNVDIYVRNSADLCLRIIITGNMKCLASKNCLSTI